MTGAELIAFFEENPELKDCQIVAFNEDEGIFQQVAGLIKTKGQLEEEPKEGPAIFQELLALGFFYNRWIPEEDW